jgi:hypothetical protein
MKKSDWSNDDGDDVRLNPYWVRFDDNDKGHARWLQVGWSERTT